MPPSAPLKITVEINLPLSPPARRFRLSREITLPPAITFDRELPLEDSIRGTVSFTLPGGPRITARAVLYCDPEHPQRGSEAELLNLQPEEVQAFQTYIEQRMQP